MLEYNSFAHDGYTYVLLIVVTISCQGHSQTDIFTFEELSEKVFSVLPKVKRVDFVTDTYKDNSIKSDEKIRGGTWDASLVKCPSTKLPKEWKLLLSNNDNKTNLCLRRQLYLTDIS
ncbi:hypothetical protein LSAT2_006703 [Lamellibrachia satsuma]|nr:hypothetical protein LSAT2_006703 [Lamellibrachia satsuma]